MTSKWSIDHTMIKWCNVNSSNFDYYQAIAYYFSLLLSAHIFSVFFPEDLFVCFFNLVITEQVVHILRHLKVPREDTTTTTTTRGSGSNPGHPRQWSMLSQSQTWDWTFTENKWSKQFKGGTSWYATSVSTTIPPSGGWKPDNNYLRSQDLGMLF